jgi:hypothetical protein
MKKLLILAFVLCCVSAIASAGIFRSSAKIVASSARLGYKVSKAPAKAASYPVRHPLKSAKKSAHAAYKIAY